MIRSVLKAGMLAPSPNPFVRATEITYMVPSTTQAAAVTLRIHDASGRLVRTLVDCWKRPGVYTAAWDGTSESGSPVSSGAYFYSLEIGETRITRKGVLLR